MKRFPFIESACAALTFAAVALWWRYPLVLTVLLTLSSIVFMRVSRHPKTWRIFLFAAIFGPVAEVICIAAGAWSYALPFAFGIPLYLPLVWGSAGLLIITFADFLRDPHT